MTYADAGGRALADRASGIVCVMYLALKQTAAIIADFNSAMASAMAC